MWNGCQLAISWGCSFSRSRFQCRLRIGWQHRWHIQFHLCRAVSIVLSSIYCHESCRDVPEFSVSIVQCSSWRLSWWPWSPETKNLLLSWPLESMNGNSIRNDKMVVTLIITAVLLTHNNNNKNRWRHRWISSPGWPCAVCSSSDRTTPHHGIRNQESTSDCQLKPGCKPRSWRLSLWNSTCHSWWFESTWLDLTTSIYTNRL